MAYTSNELITRAYYASGILSREFEIPSGAQLSAGLEFLNDVITDKTVDSMMVPYETTYLATFLPSVEVYPIPNLIQINTLVFFLNNVRFSMEYTQRNEFFGTSRVENVNSLPREWYFERGFGGGNLHIYFAPDQAYPMEVHGIFRLPTVTQFQDLSLSLDQFYITYLRYALADRLCAEWDYATPPRVLGLLRQYESWIKSKSRLIDLRMQKTSTLHSHTNNGSWASINISPGYTP